jgi:predicted nucleotidyltransferase component of viral defense system
MINRKEIVEWSRRSNVPADTIDKDYVLGHFLNVLFSEKWARESLIFKGGTCLRKCYFENYRFSEDIDLTIINQNFILTRKAINEVCEKLKDVSGIETNMLLFAEVLHNNQKVGWDIEICYWGANHNQSETPIFRKDCHTKIILEIRHFELMFFVNIERKIIHNYSDTELISNTIPCYSIQEILAEKMRALIQRNRGEARDYFDLWYIKTHVSEINWLEVKEAFFKKYTFKNIVFDDVSDLFRPERMKQVAITWDKRLSHQLQTPVDRSLVLDELEVIFTELFEQNL